MVQANGASRTAVLAGATGLVGGHVLAVLAVDPFWKTTIILGRREAPGIGSRANVVQRIVDFARLDPGSVTGATDVFCCVGTTIRKAGSEEAFRKVDLDAVLSLARAAAAAGARHFLVVSSVGADARSRVFYSRVKGEMEEALEGMGFEGLSIFRPSLLSGERAESRPGERLGIAVAELLSLIPVEAIRKFRPVPATTVARAMVRVAREGPKGVQVLESSRIHELG